MRAVVITCALLAALSGCKRTDIVGALGCARASDCSPPDTICSTDGRCVAGCAANPALCVGGSACNSATGECAGNGIGAACANDTNCDPPDVVCRVSTGTCQPGCTVSPVCASDEVCNPASGHCCAPGVNGCPMISPPMKMCNGDADCPDPPHNICSGGTCVPGCAMGGLCALPLVCNPTSGHCQPSSLCTRDLDCDNGSYCTQAGNCVVLANGGASPCAGGTTVSYTCATKTTPADFKSCVGAPGPGGCPYCIDGSCLRPGLCGVADDCHGGDSCVGGLCRALSPPCPMLVNLADIVGGVYAAGKEVCVKGVVTATRSGYDGMLEMKLNSSPYLFVDIEPMYGLTLPQVGQTVTVHGTVRWDAGHMDRELLPTDWLAVVN